MSAKSFRFSNYVPADRARHTYRGRGSYHARTDVPCVLFFTGLRARGPVFYRFKNRRVPSVFPPPPIYLYSVNNMPILRERRPHTVRKNRRVRCTRAKIRPNVCIFGKIYGYVSRSKNETFHAQTVLGRYRPALYRNREPPRTRFRPRRSYCDRVESASERLRLICGPTDNRWL